MLDIEELNSLGFNYTLEEWNNLTELAPLTNNLTMIPKSIFELINLKGLCLCYNPITSIDGIDKLVNLQWLYLDNNDLTSIDGINKLVNLTKLWLDNNLLTSIDGIDRLVNLRWLSLSNNRLTSIDGIDKLVHITHLKLDNNKFTTLPSSFDNLRYLQYLSMDKFQTLPHSLRSFLYKLKGEGYFEGVQWMYYTKGIK